MKKIAFVIPWYAEKIPGGAEMETREVTRHLHQAGLEIEILTTCVREFVSDWNENYYPEGLEYIQGIPVKRFPVRKRNTKAFDEVNLKLMNRIQPTPQEEEIFIREMINSPALYDYISANQEAYTAFVYIPYMFGTTYYGIKACPQKAVMIPCFHDEAYLYMQIYKDLYSQVAGMIFNARPELELTEKVYNTSQIEKIVMGIGMDVDLKTYPDEFRKKFHIREKFILYAGRKDSGKNVHTLLNYFGEFKKRNPSDLKLVLIGGGDIHIPESARKDTIDLGFVEIQDKYNAYGAAELLCQPSINEIFSLVIMESWLCHRPVLVHDKCAVTKNFVQESNGGLYFQDYFEFEGCLNYFLHHQEASAFMGENGRNYVLAHFDWNVITEKYKAFFERIEARQGENL
ncbi:MAG: glycosyltransferase family 4 protein [Oscillospiraceae bacterium]|nr:glycosyltransferase family 4 protein [Oscillospiraceae bacterium]